MNTVKKVENLDLEANNQNQVPITLMTDDKLYNCSEPQYLIHKMETLTFQSYGDKSLT